VCSDDIGALRDNVASAVAKMILMQPKSLPIESVLPLFLSALPLEVDMEENNFVYSSVIKMVHTFPKSNAGLIEPHFERILHVFHSVLTDKPLKDTLKIFMAKTCAGMMAQGDAGLKLTAVVNNWPPAKKAAFMAILAAAEKAPVAADAAPAAVSK
jgi:importin-4